MSFFLIWTLFIVVAVWMLMIRPQRRRMLEHHALMAGLRAGDEVVTAGGIHGRVERVDDEVVHLEIAPATVVRVVKRAIARNLSADQRVDGPDLDGPDGRGGL